MAEHHTAGKAPAQSTTPSQMHEHAAFPLPSHATHLGRRARSVHVSLLPCRKARACAQCSRTRTWEWKVHAWGRNMPAHGPIPSKYTHRETSSASRRDVQTDALFHHADSTANHFHGCNILLNPSTSSCRHSTPLGTRYTCNTDATWIHCG